jgi:hypothetical protein
VRCRALMQVHYAAQPVQKNQRELPRRYPLPQALARHVQAKEHRRARINRCQRRRRAQLLAKADQDRVA